MIFSSLIFVVLFLPVFLIVYSLSKGMERKNRILLIFSLIFYGWAGPVYILLLLAEVFGAWYIGLKIEAMQRPMTKKRYMRGGVIFLLILMLLFRYLKIMSFMTEDLPDTFGDLFTMAIPVGIAFYTLQLISYMIDLSKGQISCVKSYKRLLLYSCCFCIVTGGPIVTYGQVREELHSRKARTDDWLEGIRRFCVGLAKKVLLANACADVVARLLPTQTDQLLEVPVSGLWFGSIFFMLEIYLDLSAYCDMAIGLGRMLGFHFPENFNYPYMARSIREFWSRWFITLTDFFGKYVYPPLGNEVKDRKKHELMLLLVWALIGVWHGAGWNFLLWGLLTALFVILEGLGVFDRLPVVAKHAYVLFSLLVGWCIFHFTSLGNLGIFFRSAIGFNANGFTNDINTKIIQNNILLLVVCIVACTPVVKRLGEYVRGSLSLSKSGNVAVLVYDIVVPAILLLISIVGMMGNQPYPFLFYRF